MPGCVTAPGSAGCACRSQLASLLACQMPLKLGLPPTRAARTAWPDVRVTDTEITALTAAAAIASVIIEPENRWRMMVPFYFHFVLLQRILFYTDKICRVVFCCRVRASALCKGEVFHARSQQQRREGIVSFDATRFVIRFVFLVALFAELLFDGPWPRPHGGVFDCDDVLERGWPGPRPALDQVHIFTGALKIGFPAEVRDVDHELIALPAAPRFALPLPDVVRQSPAPHPTTPPSPPL